MNGKYILSLEQYLTSITENEYKLLLDEATQIAIKIIKEKQLTV